MTFEKINTWSKGKVWLSSIRCLIYSLIYYSYKSSVYYLDKKRVKIFNLIHSIRKDTDILLSDIEAYTLFMLVNNSKKVKGDIAEIGCFKGGSSKIICEAKGSKILYIFDTFNGLPKLSASDGKSPIKVGEYKSTIKEVKNNLKQYSNVKIYKGLFPNTANPVKNKNFSLVNLDTDIYKSTLDGLKFFYPRMTKGGVIISHDYYGCPGVKKAIDKFIKNKKEILIEIPGSQCLIVKN